MRFDPGVFFPPKNDDEVGVDAGASVFAVGESDVMAFLVAPSGLKKPPGVFIRWINAVPFILSTHECFELKLVVVLPPTLLVLLVLLSAAVGVLLSSADARRTAALAR